MRKGFTLLELLLAVSIFAVISIAVYSTFNAGMNVWRRVSATSLHEKRRVLKIEKLKKELRQSFVFKEKEITFIGGNNQLSFPVIIGSRIKKAVYSYDPSRRALLKGIGDLSEIADARDESGKWMPEMSVFVENVDNVTFSYFNFDLTKGVYSWADKWENKAGLPAAVRCNITFPENETFAETIFIPAG